LRGKIRKDNNAKKENECPLRPKLGGQNDHDKHTKQEEKMDKQMKEDMNIQHVE
jgi:hypothetical protein